MNNQPNAFFFQMQPIPDDTSLFDKFKQQKIFFSYFLVKQADKQVDRNYYLFFYSQKDININFLYQSIDVIQELDSKQRKIRSLRGLFGYDSGRSHSYQGSNPQVEEMIKTLQNQVNSLQHRISDLEITLENSKYALNPTLKAPDATKNI